MPAVGTYGMGFGAVSSEDPLEDCQVSGHIGGGSLTDHPRRKGIEVQPRVFRGRACRNEGPDGAPANGADCPVSFVATNQIG